MSDWYKLPNGDVSDAIAELVNEVRHEINCPQRHQIEVYRLAKWPRAFHLECEQCHRDVFVKSFGQDPGVSAGERQRRYDIERNNIKELTDEGLREGSFRFAGGLFSGSFNIPRLINSLGFPHYALIEEYVGSEALGEVISTAIHGGNDQDLLNGLSLLARFLVTLHERTTTEPFSAEVPSLNDPARLFAMLANVGDYGELIGQLCALHSRWVEDDFFNKSLHRCLVHDGLTPVNLLYSSVKRQLTITDLETLHYDTPLVDVGTVCAELKLSFVIHAHNSYLAEPYIGYFLREYFAHLKQPELTYRQFTWAQAYFMGRRLLIISQGTWLLASLRKWCLDEVKSVWGLIEPKAAFISPPFLGVKAVFFDFYNTLVSVEDDEGNLKNFEKVRNYVTTTWVTSGRGFPSAEELSKTYFSVIQEVLARSKEEYADVDLELVWAEVLERLKIGLPSVRIDDSRREKVREILKIFRRSALKRFGVFEGAYEAIKALKAHHFQIGIISDAQTVYVQSELERTGMLPLIDCLLISAHFSFRKPDRNIFEWGLKRLEARPEEAVFVGDDMFRDIFGAKRVGMRAIYKPSEYGCSFYGDTVPDEVVTDFWKLPELFGIPAKSG
jgi:putative hydrolase of the HAD superfamily